MSLFFKVFLFFYFPFHISIWLFPYVLFPTFRPSRRRIRSFHKTLLCCGWLCLPFVSLQENFFFLSFSSSSLSLPLHLKGQFSLLWQSGLYIYIFFLFFGFWLLLGIICVCVFLRVCCRVVSWWVVFLLFFLFYTFICVFFVCFFDSFLVSPCLFVFPFLCFFYFFHLLLLYDYSLCSLYFHLSLRSSIKKFACADRRG